MARTEGTASAPGRRESGTGDGARGGRHKHRAARVKSIAEAVVIKDEDLCFLCDKEGRVPRHGQHGLGIYYHDCRFLNCYELRLAGKYPTALLATAEDGYQAKLVQTNIRTRLPDGTLLQVEDLGIRWERLLDASRSALRDQITFQNYADCPLTLPLEFVIGSAFEDIFLVRGRPEKGQGRLYPAVWTDGRLYLLYRGRDKVYRSLTVHFSPRVKEGAEGHARLDLHLGARGSATVRVGLVVAESTERRAVAPGTAPFGNEDEVSQRLRQSFRDWMDQKTKIAGPPKAPFQRVLHRSLQDLRTLRSCLHDRTYFGAGVPWYVALFGRDSLISSIQTLAYDHAIAADTLRLMAHFQGRTVDRRRDEEPGKIMHELRVGELAHINAIPQTPYYGTIDSTPLFLILLCRHARWSGSLDLFTELRDNVEAALRWMADYGDITGDGYLSYQGSASGGKLSNQGWKDSGDSIMNADGSLAEPPIALAEVQGYAYLAKMELARLYEHAGDAARAERLRREARDLRDRFNRDFWLEDSGCFAMALQKDKRPTDVVASNAGQVLWSGIAEEDKARRTCARLMCPDMFSGWGIRTLSGDEKRYNPISYHNGSVWPHDNSLIMAGFRRYGFDDAAGRVFASLLDAALQFPLRRLPELFAGYPRADYWIPVHYPVACKPQAWAAGSVPLMVQALLGLDPDGLNGRLRVVRPLLPEDVDRLDVTRLRVGQGQASLRFTRGRDGRVSAEVREADNVEVVVEEGPGA